MTERTSAATLSRLLLNPRDASKALAICERTLWKLMDDGDLPCLRIGRSVRYDQRDLIAFIDRCKRANSSQITQPDFDNYEADRPR